MHHTARAIIAAAVALAAAACASTSRVDAGTGGATTSNSTSSSTGGTAGAGGSGTGGQATGGLGGTGGAPGGFSIAIQSAQAFANCMPIVPPDPLSLGFDVAYDNTLGATPASATITTAAVTLVKNGSQLDWSFDVLPSGSGVVSPSASALVTHTKVGGSGSGTGQGGPCGYCGGEATLAVTFAVGAGSVQHDFGPFTLACAF